MIQGVQRVGNSRLVALLGMPVRRMYYMAFLPGQQPPEAEPEPVILSYVDYVATMKRDAQAASTDKPKQSKV